jgi:hypothetical protein
MISQELVDQACCDHWRVIGTRRTGLWDSKDAWMGRQAKWLPMSPDTVEAPVVVSVVSDEDQSVPCRIRHLRGIFGASLSSIHGTRGLVAKAAQGGDQRRLYILIGV